MNTTRQYELVYLIHPDVTEEGVTDLHSQVEAVVSRLDGRIEKTDNWGRRKLAYAIAHQKEATYVLELFSGSGELVRELDRRLRVMDRVIRHGIFRVDADLQKAERARAKRTATQHRRRTARGLPPEPEAREAVVRTRDEGEEGDQHERVS